jgi:2-dehydro-3-deoxygluconokinase
MGKAADRELRMELVIRKDSECSYDLISLGEVMLRFDPGEQRIRSTRHFTVWEGGGEYNVAKGLSTCFNQRTAVVTSLVDNELGKLILSLIRSGGVDTSLVISREDDGIGRSARNGIYFLEKGFGKRPPIGMSDRAHTAVSQLAVGDIDWDGVFAKGVRWFHTGGIFAGLSETTPDVIVEATKAARRHGTVVSYDLNYRQSLWKTRGGKQKADELNRELLKQVDVVFGVESLEPPVSGLKSKSFEKAVRQMADHYPHLKVIATTLRLVKSANRNDWGGLAWIGGQVYQAPVYQDLEIYDRVGGGDAFAAGLIYGLLTAVSPEKALAYAVAHGALTMSTPGDTSLVSLSEVESLLATGDSAVIR